MTDLEGLKRVGIERKVKAQKLKELVRKGEAPRSVDEIQVDKDEYPKYLKAAYGEESFPKPRNADRLGGGSAGAGDGKADDAARKSERR